MQGISTMNMREYNKLKEKYNTFIIVSLIMLISCIFLKVSLSYILSSQDEIQIYLKSISFVLLKIANILSSTMLIASIVSRILIIKVIKPISYIAGYIIFPLVLLIRIVTLSSLEAITIECTCIIVLTISILILYIKLKPFIKSRKLYIFGLIIVIAAIIIVFIKCFIGMLFGLIVDFFITLFKLAISGAF